MSRVGVSVAALFISLSSLTVPAAHGKDGTCSAGGDLGDVEAVCAETAEEARKRINKDGTGPGASFLYRATLKCRGELDADGMCDMIGCGDSNEARFVYSLQRSPIGLTPPAWTHVVDVCLTSPDELIQTISAADVAREFKRLTWPAARMTIQPPDGETLVNLPTIFFTNDTAKQTQTVTLLGQTVEIEATPTEWTWRWATSGDGGTADDRAPLTTTDPGAPHPNATVTHAYTRADTTVRPSLDVTYTGQYRVNNGPWEEIPATHTVTGAPQSLRVLEARPTLVR
ncbi:hypothetical protein FCL41_15060 [Nocardioides jishulii]|uniref:hypothetical protein n=1 Tax=Nocardioides jishulii TaxID=2575440 RepID=UPI00110DA1CF|nr:hypothetical protein [Nocardioides jishulii]QCX28704.1 hypothetical protein FCL41_15060 [Nocardioides jishulii]